MQHLQRFILIILSAIGYFSENLAHANDSLNIAEAKKQVRLLMKDPSSTQFQGLKLVTNLKGIKSVCGLVNSKNSYGGYVGYKPFSYTPSTKAITFLGDYSTSIELQDEADKFASTGCLGVKAEKKGAVSPLVPKFCNITAGFLHNILVKNIPEDLALDNAINLYKEKNLTPLFNNLDIPEQFLLESLNKAQKNQNEIETLKMSLGVYGMQYENTCKYRLEKYFK